MRIEIIEVFLKGVTPQALTVMPLTTPDLHQIGRVTTEETGKRRR